MIEKSQKLVRAKVSENDLEEIIKQIEILLIKKESQITLNQIMKIMLVRPPGFGPGLKAWKAFVLDQARPRSQT